MLNADKYIDRLRVIVKNEEKYYKSFFIERIKDVIKDYDNDFDKAMEEMEDMSNWHEGIQPLKK